MKSTTTNTDNAGQTGSPATNFAELPSLVFNSLPHIADRSNIFAAVEIAGGVYAFNVNVGVSMFLPGCPLTQHAIENSFDLSMRPTLPPGFTHTHGENSPALALFDYMRALASGDAQENPPEAKSLIHIIKAFSIPAYNLFNTLDDADQDGVYRIAVKNNTSREPFTSDEIRAAWHELAGIKPILPTVEEILVSPIHSDWLKNALRTALTRDCVDASNDANTLALVLNEACREAMEGKK